MIFTREWARIALVKNTAKMYTCTYNTCSRIFAGAYNFKIHVLQEHFGMQISLCACCGRGYTSSVCRTAHQITCIATQVQACAQCGLTFSSRQARYRHESMRTCHRMIGKATAHRCACGVWFGRKAALQQHWDKRNVCAYTPPPSARKICSVPMCTEFFYSSTYLRYHVNKCHK